ncbi:hypothetical protein L2E82_49338 [Cichorium intybus]|uniref:Uncharacterized protein n=1 Tax=Cichorium intybus TaxID=13427 RepID=A0ACB8Z4I1_CICIN|nr:hypothetical protein L2E82_49338 [Cichorium intybus]
MTQAVGTLAYIDPQYAKTGKLTKESDVYSFGVVLFEALSGRLAHFPLSKDDPEFLPHMAKRCFQQKNVNQIIDSKFKKEFEKVGSPILDDETCPNSVKIFAEIAYKCCQKKREDRPTMADVVKELERAFKSHVKGVEALRTTLDDVISATNDFHDIKEQGPLGEVYSGALSHLRGHNTVTIKRLHRSLDSYGEEFCKEIARLYMESIKIDQQQPLREVPSVEPQPKSARPTWKDERVDEWEWEQKLPTDYKKIIQMSKYSVPSTISKKDLYSLFSSGIILNNEKRFSIRTDGSRNEMIPAKRFSYKDISSLKWRSIQKSRFPKVAKIFDISNLNIGVQITNEFLTPDTMYGAYLVFKFCDRRKVSNRPIYVNLKYKKAGETLNSYFAEWKEGGSQWLGVELLRFSSNRGSTDFEVVLESFSKYYCGTGGIFVEGIEFQAIRSANLEQKKELKDGKNVGVVLERQLDVGSKEQMITDNREIIKRSNVRNASKEKLFSLNEVNRKRCHMLPAKAIIYSSANVKLCKPPTESRCRFAEVVEILSHQDFRIKCDIETKMLSSDATYACYLVYKHSKNCRGLECPVKARDLLPYRKERTKIISFTYPSTVNMDKIKWIPEEREDGWMEIIVWETIFDNTNNDEYIPMDLKLTCFEGNMSGLIVYGIEFRPIA